MAGARRTTRQSQLKGFWDRPLPELLEALETTPAGLASDEAQRRLRVYGPNALAKESRVAALIGFLRFFANPLVIILLVASDPGLMITRVIMALVLFVLLVNILLHRPLLESFLFSIALAVGMTPEMMPTIITVTLARGPGG